MIKFALGLACSLSEMLINFKKKYFTVSQKECKKHTGDEHKRVVIKQMFKYCLQLIVEDIVDNNVTFWLPIAGTKANLHMKMYEGEAFKKLRLHHKWKNLDFIASDFKGYQINLFTRTSRGWKTKPVHVSVRYRDLIDKNASEGMAYGDGVRDTKLADYLPKIYEKYPWIPLNDIKRTLTFMWRSLFLITLRGCDIHIKFPDFWCYMGRIPNNGLDMCILYERKLVAKIRYKYFISKKQWDGYYYFSLSEEDFQEYKKSIAWTGRPRKWFEFKNIFAYMLEEENIVINGHHPHTFRIPYVSKIGMKRYFPYLKTDKAEYLGYHKPYKFVDILTSNKKPIHYDKK